MTLIGVFKIISISFIEGEIIYIYNSTRRKKKNITISICEEINFATIHQRNNRYLQ
jgi:hypothetical protein